MSFYHGASTAIVDIGGRPIEIPASSIIGLVGTYKPGEGKAEPNQPTLITSKTEAVKRFGEKDAVSTIPQALEAIYAQAKCVVVVIGVPMGSTDDITQSNIIGKVDSLGKRTGIEALLDSKSETDQRPRILIAPGYSSEQAVATKLDSIAQRLRAIAVVDGPNTTDEAAMQHTKLFGSKRLYMVDPGVKYWDTGANTEKVAPASSYLAGVIARTDNEIGYWASPSNKPINNILGTSRPIDYEHGDISSRANLLNNANVTTIIRDGGFKVWGNRTLSSDPKWKYITRVRIADIIMDAVLAGHQWVIDRNASSTLVKDVTEGLQEFLTTERSKGAIINFEVFPDPEMNSKAEVANGRVYWNVRMTDAPPVENPIFRFEVTDEFLTEIFE